MSNFFKNVLSDLDGVEQELLGPDYSYKNHIKSPSEIGMSGDGNLSTMASDIGGLIAYTELLVTGGGEASKVAGPLGDQFFLKTGAQCTDTVTKKLVTRSIYINNIPQGDIPFLSSGMGMNFTVFEGLLPGILSNLTRLNPLAIFQSFLSGSHPDCMPVTLQTVDSSNQTSTGTGYLTITDVKNIDPCEFPNHTNPVTGDSRSVCNRKVPNVNPTTVQKCKPKDPTSNDKSHCNALSFKLKNCLTDPKCEYDWSGNKLSSNVEILGTNGKSVSLDATTAYTQFGTGQKQDGCWSLDNKKGSNWQGPLKGGGASCEVAAITLPYNVEATAYTSGGGWGNLCTQQKLEDIPAGTVNHIFKTSPCGFLFREVKGGLADEDKNIIITGKDGQKVTLNADLATEKSGAKHTPISAAESKASPGITSPPKWTDDIWYWAPTKLQKGCWTFDTSKKWQDVLKNGQNCVAKSISLPPNVKATPYGSTGGWDDLCKQNKFKEIPAGFQDHTFGAAPCGFLFEKVTTAKDPKTKKDGFTNRNTVSVTDETVDLLDYLYLIAMLIFFSYIFSKSRGRRS